MAAPVRPQIVLLSANPEVRITFRRIFDDSGWSIRESKAIVRLADAIDSAWMGVLLTDYTLPDGNWRTAMAVAKKVAFACETVVTSRIADERMWAEVLNLGAFDLIPQPIDPADALGLCTGAWRRVKSTRYQTRTVPPSTTTVWPVI